MNRGLYLISSKSNLIPSNDFSVIIVFFYSIGDCMSRLYLATSLKKYLHGDLCHRIYCLVKMRNCRITKTCLSTWHYSSFRTFENLCNRRTLWKNKLTHEKMKKYCIYRSIRNPDTFCKHQGLLFILDHFSLKIFEVKPRTFLKPKS